MLPLARRPIELEPGTPVADAVTRGRAAFVRADADGGDAAYQEAVRLAAGDPRLWSALAAEHADGLRALRRATLALQRCAEYLYEPGADHISLRLLRAEICSFTGDHSRAGADATAIRTALASQPNSLATDDSARLHRVEALSAADRGDLDRAVRHLNAARQHFLEAGNQAGAAAIEVDRVQLQVRQGDESAVSDVLSGEPPQTVSDYLLLSAALRHHLRYEEAYLVLYRGLEHDIDPALRWHVLYELIQLLRLIRQDDAAELLLLALHKAVAAAVDPATAAAAIARLSAAGAPSDAISPRFDRRLQYARRLIIETRLDDAESLLGELRSRAHTDRDISTWHLAAGELELARRNLSENRSCAQAAVGHLAEAVTRASAIALVEVRVCALRSLGHAFDRLDADDRAAECWAEAHRLEENIARRQITDNVRIRMLPAVPDEFDARIRAASAVLDVRGPEAAAPIVVAMEAAARRAAILGFILPDKAGLDRDIPRPSDLHGAWRWVRNMADGLPRTQVAWIIHPTPDRVHHAIMGRGLLYHTSVPSRRNKLTAAIDNLMACWSNGEESLEYSIVGGEFDEHLKEVAAQVGISAVIPKLPPHIRRIAIVAGDAVSDIPFAAMTTPEGTELIGLRFALSNLPCLSARLPLHRRSLRLRGDRQLLVSPPAYGLTPAAGRRGRTVLDGERATRAGLQAALELHLHRQVRIDGCGHHDHGDPTKSWLQLAPEGPGGRLRPEELQGMDLRGCGTLVLGACESGMAQRVGRGERIGFVRAAVHAGAAAVVGARWAVDSVAATVLDRFERYVRYLPRDLALQQAQLDAYRGAPGTPVDLPTRNHPARWACWTLYGDSGWQTGAGPLRRLLRRSLNQRKGRVADV